MRCSLPICTICLCYEKKEKKERQISSSFRDRFICLFLLFLRGRERGKKGERKRMERGEERKRKKRPSDKLGSQDIVICLLALQRPSQGKPSQSLSFSNMTWCTCMYTPVSNEFVPPRIFFHFEAKPKSLKGPKIIIFRAAEDGRTDGWAHINGHFLARQHIRKNERRMSCRRRRRMRKIVREETFLFLLFYVEKAAKKTPLFLAFISRFSSPSLPLLACLLACFCCSNDGEILFFSQFGHFRLSPKKKNVRSFACLLLVSS